MDEKLVCIVFGGGGGEW